MKSINQTIADFRKESAISQKQLAEEIGVRPATISDFENGKNNIGSDKLQNIMEVLNLTVSKLPDNGKSAEAKEK